MKIESKLTLNKVQFDQETEAHLVLELTAPEAVKEEDKRQPLCIIPLLDVSPSMLGEKLMYAKRSIIKLIDHLSPNDYCGLISFSGVARVESKPVKCTVEAKQELKKKVEELQVSGSTNIADALLEGFKLVEMADLPAEVINRVILFTDGMANTGPVTHPSGLVELVKSNKGLASASAFGYGRDVAQDFLLDLAKTGTGNYAFVENPDDALSAFGKELGGLLSTYATNLLLEVTPLKGHEITEVVSDVDVEEGPLGITIKIPDILSEETRHIVLAVKLQAQKSAGPRAVNVIETSLGYDILDSNMRREHKQSEVKAKVQFVKAGEQSQPDPELDRIVGLAQIVRAQIAAEEYARQGNFHQAVNLMSETSKSVGRRGMGDLGILAQSISGRLTDSHTYASSTSYLAGFSRGATRGVGGTYGDEVERDLMSAGVQLNNESQTRVAESFSAAGSTGSSNPDAPVQTQTGDFPGGESQVGDFPDVVEWDLSQLHWGTHDFTIGPISIEPALPPTWITTTSVSEIETEEVENHPKSKKTLAKKSKRWQSTLDYRNTACPER